MHLSELGKVVTAEWQKTISLRADMNLELGGFKSAVTTWARKTTFRSDGRRAVP